MSRPDEVVDLMAALQRSIERAKADRKAASENGTDHGTDKDPQPARTDGYCCEICRSEERL